LRLSLGVLGWELAAEKEAKWLGIARDWLAIPLQK
jgi:hypothetical protein